MCATRTDIGAGCGVTRDHRQAYLDLLAHRHHLQPLSCRYSVDMGLEVVQDHISCCLCFPGHNNYFFLHSSVPSQPWLLTERSPCAQYGESKT
jgi:hypothetical protein